MYLHSHFISENSASFAGVLGLQSAQTIKKDYFSVASLDLRGSILRIGLPPHAHHVVPESGGHLRVSPLAEVKTVHGEEVDIGRLNLGMGRGQESRWACARDACVRRVWNRARDQTMFCRSSRRKRGS